MDTTFSSLNLNKPLLEALADLGLEKPTPIQQKAFAPIMAGKNVLGIAQTGTGKTFAYLLPLMRMWQFNKKRNPETIIIVPTRELVVQVEEEYRKLAKYTNQVIAGTYGGANIKAQMSEIVQGVDAVVATPGRLLDLMLNGTIPAKGVKKLVIDEVDEMLNLGFRSQLQTVIDLIPEKRQTLMFSATITEEINTWIEKNLRTPERIEAAETGKPLENIAQFAYELPNYFTKINLLQHLLTTDASMTKVLVFAGSKRLATDVSNRIEKEFPGQVAVIHSNKAQNNRFKVVEQFETGGSRILIASDIVARGLDVSAVSHVINMDVPAVAENYIHRIGRTGRADQKGVAITFVTETDQGKRLMVEELMGMPIELLPFPENVEVSKLFTPEEQPSVNRSTKVHKQPKIAVKGAAHHEKKEKNKKVNIKVTRADKMKLKYGKRYQAGPPK